MCIRDRGGAVAHHHIQNVWHVVHEENEGEERAPNERVGKNFAENVSGQDAHRIALAIVYRFRANCAEPSSSSVTIKVNLWRRCV